MQGSVRFDKPNFTERIAHLDFNRNSIWVMPAIFELSKTDYKHCPRGLLLNPLTAPYYAVCKHFWESVNLNTFGIFR